MKTTLETVQHNRPAIFDWCVLILSFSLGFIFPSLGDFFISKQFSWWMLISLLLYITGTLLKHIPLSLRLQRTGKKREMPFVIFLWSGHWCIMILLIIFAESAVFKSLGMPSMLAKDAKNGWFIIFTMVSSLFLTWLVYRAKKLPKSYKPKPGHWQERRELVADLCLILSVSVVTYVLWEKGVMAMLGTRAVKSFSEVAFLFVFFSICYVLLYLPLRYLYLIEDFSSRQTWKRMLMIFAFLLLRSFFEIMRI